jgi:hypothetical protein
MCFFNEVIYLFEKIFQNFPVFLYDFTFQTQFSIFFFKFKLFNKNDNCILYNFCYLFEKNNRRYS